MDDRPLLKVAEVAAQLNISPSKAYDLCKAGTLPSVRIGRSVRVHPDALKDYIAAGGQR